MFEINLLFSDYLYPHLHFPHFLSGSGYLIPRLSSDCLLEQSKSIPLVFLEDAYITGLCGFACGLRRLNNVGFKAQLMENITNYQLRRKDIVIHYSTGQMLRFFEQNKAMKYP